MIRLLALVLSLASAQQNPLPPQIPTQIRDFSGGYVDNTDPVNLKPNESPDMLNVLIDDPVGSLKPRRGFIQCGILPSGNVPTALFEYSKSDGTRRLIASDNANVYSTPDCQTWTTITTGLSSSAQIQFKTIRDNLWIVNGSTWPMTWDGTTLTLLDGRTNTPNPAPPKCSFIEFWKERVWCAAPSGNPSMVAFSALTDSLGNDLSPSTGTLAWPAVDAFQIDQNAGSRVYGIKAYRNRLYVFKDNGVWEIGFDNDYSNFVRKTYATRGTRFNTSIVEVDGILYFTGRDGIYAFDGDNAVRISEKVRNKFNTINQVLISQNYKTWNKQADFDLGTFDVMRDSDVSNTLTLSSRPVILENGDFETGLLTPHLCGIADSGAASSPQQCGVTAHAAVGQIGGVYVSTLSIHCALADASASISVFTLAGTTVYTEVPTFASGGATSTRTLTTSAYDGQTVRLHLHMECGNAPAADHADFYTSTFVARGDLQWAEIGVPASCSGGGCNWVFDNIQNNQYFSSGSWTSEFYNTVQVSTWGAFNADSSNFGGSVAYDIRYGTNTGAAQSMAFASISPGALIPANTSQVIVQVRARPSASADLKYTTQITNLQISWNNGGANTQQVYAQSWNNSLWLSASTGTAATNNFVFQRGRNIDAWMPQALQIGPMATFNDLFYAGASTHSAIYRMDYGTNDNGVAIPWRWASRDENYGIPNNAKQLREIVTDFRNNASCNIRIGYVQDQNTTYCVGNAPSPNANLANGVGSRRLFFNGGPAYTYRIKVCDDQKDQTPTIMGLGTIATPIQRRGD